MKFESPEIEKLRKAWGDCGPGGISMVAKLETPHGLVEVDLCRILLELAARDDSNLHFMDPPKHHADTGLKSVLVEADMNPTGQKMIGP